MTAWPQCLLLPKRGAQFRMLACLACLLYPHARILPLMLQVAGYVKSAGPAGVFVCLARNLDARIRWVSAHGLLVPACNEGPDGEFAGARAQPPAAVMLQQRRRCSSNQPAQTPVCTGPLCGVGMVMDSHHTPCTHPALLSAGWASWQMALWSSRQTPSPRAAWWWAKCSAPRAASEWQWPAGG